MKNVKIAFSMSVDHAPETNLAATGKIVSRQLVFSDSEGNVYRFDLNPPRLGIIKTGNVVTRLELCEGTQTQGTVLTSGTTFRLDVRCGRLTFADASIEAEYDLVDGNTVLSHHEMSLRWDSDDKKERNSLHGRFETTVND
ncbi:MAG TPA: hypothetical protein P5154_01685 [Candidatus Izemoplasmatales bacterium]|nr:hypothetical protein [Candidatus Izemoplasmatales bacterium]